MRNVYLILSITLAFLVSCSSPQDEAKKKLQSLGIELTGNSLITQSKKGNATNVSLLLTAGVSVDSLGEKGYPALAWAAAKGHTSVVDVLLAAGVDKDRIDKDGDTALLSAVKMGKTDAAVTLIEAGAQNDVKNKKGKTALDLAFKKELWPVVAALGKAGVNLDEQDEKGRTRLLRAMPWADNKKEEVEALINGGASCNLADKDGNTAFTKAVKHDQASFAALCAKNGADVNAQQFVQNGASALVAAVYFNEGIELAKVLIEAGADVNAAWKANGESCLHLAVGNNRKDLVELLIKSGANVNSKDKKGDTPLYEALFKRKGMRQEIADTLVQAGADATIKTFGTTYLIHAVLYGPVESIGFLAKNGAAVNVYTDNLNSPLTVAILNKRKEALNALINAGADVNLANKKGVTPLQYAEKYKDAEIIAMLEKAGATK